MMKTKIKNVVLVVMAITLVSVLVVWAGSPDSPGPPTGSGAGAAQMYTLKQIYDRLDAGTEATKMSSFTEPAAGPPSGATGTMHTLNEIYDLIGERAPVPKTGAGNIDGYTEVAGEDGHAAMQKGVAWPNPRFTNNGDGTVTDNLTGLIWLQNANCFGSRLWSDALADANGLASGSCGLSDGSSAGDWRLPHVRELQSLVHYGFYAPAVPNTAGTAKWTTDGQPFTGVQSGSYWSSTTTAGTTGSAWSVNLYDGSVYYGDKHHDYYVWPVRGGQ